MGFPVVADQLDHVSPERVVVGRLDPDLIPQAVDFLASPLRCEFELALGEALQKAAAGLASLLGPSVHALQQLVGKGDHHLGHRVSIDGIAQDPWASPARASRAMDRHSRAPICEPSVVTLLAAKVLLAPLCVLAVSLAGRRWGMAIAGILGGLPVVAGPILLVETLLHGDGFGADAAAGTVLGLAALTAFLAVYAWVAVKAGPVASVLSGWAAFLIAVALLRLVQPPVEVSLALVAACFAIGLKLLPPAPRLVPATFAHPWWDLPARALSALGLVVALTAVSGALGPHLSGLLAPFPIITSVLAVFTHAHGGTGQLGVLLRNFLIGFYGFATFCFVLAIALPGMGSAPAFALAALMAVAVQTTAFFLRSRLVVAPSMS